MSELAPRWETMTKAEQVALGTTLAGVNQYKVFSAVMTNFDTAIKATGDALGSQGSAMEENEKYMESLQARVQQLKAELQKFILAENSLQQIAKVVLKDLINIIKVLNTFGGKLTIVSMLLIVTIDTLISKISILKSFAIFNSLKEIGQLIKTFLIPAFQQFGVQALFSADAVDILNLSLQALNINPYMLAITAVIAALAAGIYIIHEYNHALDKQKDKFEETTSSLEEYESKLEGYKNNLENTTSQIENLTKELDRLNNIQRDLTESEQEHKNKIEKKLRSLESEQIATENLIRLEEKLREEQQKRVDTQGYETLTTHRNWGASEDSNIVDILENKGYITNEEAFGNKNKDTVQTLELYSKALARVSEEYNRVKNSRDEFANDDEYQEALAQANQDYLDVAGAASKIADEVYNVRNSVSEGSEAWNYANQGIEAYENAVNESTDMVEQDIDSLRNEFGDLDDTTEETEDEFESLREEFNATDDEINKAKSLLSELGIKENALQKEIGMSSIELVRQAKSWGESAKALYDYLTAMNYFNESLDNVQSAYKTLSSAVDEYNSMQGFSIDTVQTLMTLSPEYLGMLEEENGVMKLNKDAIKDMVQAMALKAKQEIYNNAVSRLNALSTEDGRQAEIAAGIEYDNSTGKLKENTNALLENAEAEYMRAIAKNRASGGSTKDTYINQIIRETQQQIDLLDKMVEGLGKDFSTAMGDSTKSTKETNSALKEQNQLLKQQKQELEEKKKQYDTVVSYIKKKIQGEIDKLKDQKKAEVDAIKDKIDAIKDEKEAESDRIDEQIDKLKEQKEAEEEYWQKKIDALKEQNEELNTQLEYEELLEDLAKAKAKRVRVYKEGQGFVYTEDTNEIDKAQAKLDEFNRKQSYEKQLKELEDFKEKSKKNYEKQIEDLEKFKEQKEKNYDEQIKKLEEQQKAIEEKYDAQIKYFQDYLDKFTEQTDAYENQQNRLLALQLTGIDFEAQGWQTRLDNLANFVEKYNALLGDIHTLDSVVDSGDTTDQPKTDGSDEYTEEDKRKDVNKIKDSIKKDVINNRDLADKIKQQKTAEWYKKNYGGKKATGDSYIKEDGVYLVGDNPNQELVLGSKINGSLMNLTKGSGVVNATSTNTLAGILNQLGSMGSVVNTSNTSNKNTTISIGNISLPSVSNGKDFVDYLQNFSLQMTQEAFA